MILVEYLIAAVLKGWHTIFTGVLQVPASAAWLASLIMLVITVRGLLVPLAYRQFRSTRIISNLRPRIRALEAEYEDRHDAESRAELTAARRALHKEHGYHAADGCIPALLQIPFIIGLYRLLIRIAHPLEGVDENVTHPGIGLLSGDDIHSFLDSTLFGIPLPAYVAMTDAQAANLGTDLESVFKLVAPMAILASLFTTVNWAYSLKRNLRTMEHSSTLNRWGIGLYAAAGPIIFISPFVVAFITPGPVALMIYWVCNNLWTMAQVVIIQKSLDRTHPFTQEFDEFNAAEKAARKQRRRDIKRLKHEVRTREAELQQLGGNDTTATAHASKRAELDDAKRRLDELVHGPKRVKKARAQARNAQLQLERAERRAQKVEAKRERSESDAD